MSQTLVPRQPDVVARSRHIQLRSLIALACIAIIGLSIAVGVLTNVGNASRPAAVRVRAANAAVQTTDTGARLDHRGLHDTTYLLGLADIGAHLDHRGIRTSLKH
jgi:hypothetical protein